MTNPINNFLNENRTDQIYQVGKTQANIRSAYGVFNAIIGGIVFFLIGLFFFFVAKVPLIGGIIMIVGIIIPLGTYFNRKKEMNLLSQKINVPNSQTATVSGDEMVVDYIPGVMAVGGHAATFVLGGGGAMSAPENSIVRTNKNVWFVFVPMPGADVTTQHTGMGIAQFDYLLGYKDIEEKLKSLLSTGGIHSLINTSPKNFSIPLEELKNVSFNMLGNVVFETVNGNKYSYGVGGGDNKEKLKRIFQDKLEK